MGFIDGGGAEADGGDAADEGAAGGLIEADVGDGDAGAFEGDFEGVFVGVVAANDEGGVADFVGDGRVANDEGGLLTGVESVGWEGGGAEVGGVGTGEFDGDGVEGATTDVAEGEGEFGGVEAGIDGSEVDGGGTGGEDGVDGLFDGDVGDGSGEAGQVDFEGVVVGIIAVDAEGGETFVGSLGKEADSEGGGLSGLEGGGDGSEDEEVGGVSADEGRGEAGEGGGAGVVPSPSSARATPTSSSPL